MLAGVEVLDGMNGSPRPSIWFIPNGMLLFGAVVFGVMASSVSLCIVESDEALLVNDGTREGRLLCGDDCCEGFDRLGLVRPWYGSEGGEGSPNRLSASDANEACEPCRACEDATPCARLDAFVGLGVRDRDLTSATVTAPGPSPSGGGGGRFGGLLLDLLRVATPVATPSCSLFSVSFRICVIVESAEGALPLGPTTPVPTPAPLCTLERGEPEFLTGWSVSSYL